MSSSKKFLLLIDNHDNLFKYFNYTYFTDIKSLIINIPFIITLTIDIMKMIFLNISLFEIVSIFLLIIIFINISKIERKLYDILNQKTNFLQKMIEIYKEILFYTSIKEDPVSYVKLIFYAFTRSLLFNLVLLFLQIHSGINFTVLIFALTISNAYLIYIILKPFILKSYLNSGLDKEIQMLYVVFTSFLTIGINPYIIIEIISRNPFFSYFKKIYMQLEKIRILYMLNPIETISKYSHIAYHPELKELFITVSSTGAIELHKIMKSKMIDSFKLLERKIENLLEKFNVLLASQLLVFILVPITMIVSAIFIGMNIFMAFIIFIVLPILFFVAFLFILRNSIPSFLVVSTSMDYKNGLLVLFTSLAILFFLYRFYNIDPSYMLLIPSIITLFSLFYFNFYRYRNHEKLIDTIPKMIRELSEEIKKGNSPLQALEKIIDRFDEYIKLFLRKLVFLKRFGSSITNALTKERLPLMFKQIFSIIEYTDQAGADPIIYSELSDFVDKLDNSRKIYKLKTRFFKYSSYFVTALLAASISISISIMNNLVSAFNTVNLIYTGPSFFIINATPNWLYEIALFSSYLNSILLGYLGGSLGYNHIEGIKNSIICLLIAFLVLQIFQIIKFGGF